MTPLAATDGLSHLWDLNSNKPTIVFIPSFFHTAAHYGPLSRHLQAQSYDNFALRLPSISDRAGTASACMSDDVATVRRLLEALVKEEEEDVVLVMHSYGAVPGCQAVTGFEKSLRDKDGKGGGVVSLVVVCGLLVEEGESIESTLLAIGEKGLPEYAKVETPLIHPINAPSFLFSDLPPAKATYWTSQLDPQSSSVLSATVHKTCWDTDIPITYIHCSKDPNAKAMEAMLTKTKRKDWIIRTIKAGQDPCLSCVEEMGEMIIGAGKMKQRGAMG